MEELGKKQQEMDKRMRMFISLAEEEVKKK